MRMVNGINDIGRGYAALQIFSATLGMDCMSRSTYYVHFHQITADMEAEKKKVLETARGQVHGVYKERYPLSADESVLDIVVSYDGTYHKGGYTSLYGVGVTIDIESCLVVDYEVLSKFCYMCSTTTSE